MILFGGISRDYNLISDHFMGSQMSKLAHRRAQRLYHLVTLLFAVPCRTLLLGLVAGSPLSALAFKGQTECMRSRYEELLQHGENSKIIVHPCFMRLMSASHLQTQLPIHQSIISEHNSGRQSPVVALIRPTICHAQPPLQEQKQASRQAGRQTGRQVKLGVTTDL
ncbi:hypothetical protein F5Y12DRAFT_674907 [Xylaria sp. FL1777]|nr:hypothetical protein F5Y12DRAFT_674907 [Xylaria sp. FL1777]